MCGCDRCLFGEVVDDAIGAGLILKGGNKAFERMFAEAPGDTAELVSNMAARAGHWDLAARALKHNPKLERAYQEHAATIFRNQGAREIV